VRNPTTTERPEAGEPTGPPVDGRTARRERGRQAVIETVVQLLHEGHAPPPTAMVTQRAGVSEATLFRYFESIADLQFQATGRFIETHRHLFAIPNEGKGALSARIERFAAARGALWEAIAPVARLGRARAFDNPDLASVLGDTRRTQQAQAARHFAPELATMSPAAREDAAAMITAIASFETWDLQRFDLNRTPAQIKRAWRTTLRSMLETTSEPES